MSAPHSSNKIHSEQACLEVQGLDESAFEDKVANKKTAHQNCPHESKVSCADCNLNKVCLPMALDLDDVDMLDNIVTKGRPVQKGRHIYRQQDAFASIYAVRSGSVKTYSIGRDGSELVTGFYFPGEILGLDGVGRNHHVSSAKAMEVSTVCEIPFARLGQLSQNIPSLQQHCFQLMSKEIIDDRQLLALLNKSNAEARVATFLLSLSARKARNKQSATRFRLPMVRADMGSYLGLTVETISRVLSKFQRDSLLEVKNKEIVLLDIDTMRSIGGASGIE